MKHTNSSVPPTSASAALGPLGASLFCPLIFTWFQGQNRRVSLTRRTRVGRYSTKSSGTNGGKRNYWRHHNRHSRSKPEVFNKPNANQAEDNDASLFHLSISRSNTCLFHYLFTYFLCFPPPFKGWNWARMVDLNHFTAFASQLAPNAEFKMSEPKRLLASLRQLKLCSAARQHVKM